jgi:hypothetical protein
MRVVIPPATPPPPGSFAADYQAVMATASNPAAGSQPTPAPRKRGLGAMLGAVMSGAAPDAGGEAGENAAEQAGATMDRMRVGHLTRYTYYKGWLRTDDPVTQTATIEKCNEHQYITLNLGAKTYTVTNTQPPCPTTMPVPGPMGRPQQNAPGTADLTMTGTSSNLGPMTLDGVATAGSDRSMEVAMTNATGSCQNSDVKMSLMQYVSQIHVPRAYCPLPHTAAPADLIARGGCKPTMHGNAEGFGSGEGGFAGRLVMYSRMSMGSMAMVTERGGVKWFGGPAADALFAIPPGFTQAP